MTRILFGLLKGLFEVVKTTAPLIIALVAVKLLLNPEWNSEGAKKYANYFVGIVFVFLGLFIFLRGVSVCLEPLADDVGHSLRGLLPNKEGTGFSGMGVTFVLIICFIIGFAATLVEPALKSLAEMVYVQTEVVRPKVLIYSTAIGVAIAMVLGIVKVIYQIKTGYIIVPMLLIALVLCVLLMLKDRQNHFMLSVAFDCAGATTGPVNIPINAAIALGLAIAMGVDPMKVGFGLVGLTTLGAATAVMIAGLLAR